MDLVKYDCAKTYVQVVIVHAFFLSNQYTWVVILFLFDGFTTFVL